MASIYGMNVDLPMQNNPFAFALVMGFALLLSILLVIIFIRKKYF
ncbi:MAG TPA: CorA family divalent cation transporter [Candidatus Cloacimonadota bacterium]|nr:CorA family divalent cation transporter [Candidatus Cloacimonadota bacterium]